MNTNRTIFFLPDYPAYQELHMLKKGKRKPPHPPLEGKIK